VASSATDIAPASFFRHARNYLLGSVAAGVVGFLTVSVLTRLLTKEEYGVLKVWMSVVTIFGVIVELNLRGAVNRYYLEETDDFPSFLKSVLLFLAAFTLFNLTWAWFLRGPLGDFLELDPLLAFLTVVVAIVLVPWNLNWKLMGARLESAQYSALRVLRDAVLLGVGAAWILSLPAVDEGVGGREYGMVWGTLAVNGAFSAYLLVKLWRTARPGPFSRSHLRYALAFGVPLVPHALSGFILQTFDRVIIQQLEGEGAAGLYSFAYDVGAVMSMVVIAMNQAWLPIFTLLRNREQHERIHRTATTYSQVLVAVALVIVLFAHELAYLLGGERFSEALPIIPIVVMSYVALFMYNVYSNHSFYLRRSSLISLATLIAGVVNVVLNYALIPHYGYAVAAWTTLGSYLLMFALHYALARWLLREPVTPVLPILGWFALGCAASAGIVFAEDAIGDLWLTFFAVKLPALGLLGAWAVRAYRLARARGRAAVPEADPTPATEQAP
jgi:O-antigen/teichoic acid export membrane protein